MSATLPLTSTFGRRPFWRLMFPMMLRQSTFRVICASAALFALSLLLFYHQGTTVYLVPKIHPYSATNGLNDINNHTLGFEKVFVVGLPERTDRRDRMIMQAAVTDFEIEFVDGIMGDTVPEKVIPSSPDHRRLPKAVIGSWRAHMNAIKEVVARNLSSALIMEDDVDWDVRLRRQLRDFARSSRTLLQPLEPHAGGFGDVTHADLTLLDPSSHSELPDSIMFDQLPATSEPKFSPYGDDWDLLWIGHCGMQFPSRKVKGKVPKGIPKGQVIHENDETVPEKRYMWSLNAPFTLVEKFPQHTSAVHHVREGVCTLGYAVSQHGARRLMEELALKDVSDPFDILLRFFCEGAKGRKRHTCLTSQPGFFFHHHAVGPKSAASDIGKHGTAWIKKASTDVVRWSTRLNIGTLIEGGTKFHDQYPDSKEKD